MMPVVTLHYLLVCGLCFLCAAWMIVKVLREPDPVAGDDAGEGFGGIPGGFIFPVFDPPGGCHFADLLVDRQPADETETALSHLIGTTDRPARRHPVLSDPTQRPAGWYAAAEMAVEQ